MSGPEKTRRRRGRVTEQVDIKSLLSVCFIQTLSTEQGFTRDVLCVADTAVADVALNILCLLMKDQWSWLCTENIQKTIRLLFGTFIERWDLL